MALIRRIALVLMLAGVARASDIVQPMSWPVPAITKGVSGNTGWSTQELKDAGRSFVVFVATGIAGTTSESLFSFSVNIQGSLTPSVTSYVVPNGKILRLQGLYCSNRDGAVVPSWTRVMVRYSPKGSTTVSSPAIFGGEVGSPAALVGSTGYLAAPLPDGLEIVGGTLGGSIGVSHIDQDTTNVVSCTLVGFLY